MSDFNADIHNYRANQYTTHDLPVWLQTIITEMQHSRHGRRFKNCVPADQWLLNNRAVWERVLQRGQQLWFLTVKDYKIFHDTAALAAAAVAAGYETKCREIPDWMFKNGKASDIPRLDPLHMVPDWVLNNSNTTTANHERTAQ